MCWKAVQHLVTHGKPGWSPWMGPAPPGKEGLAHGRYSMFIKGRFPALQEGWMHVQRKGCRGISRHRCPGTWSHRGAAPCIPTAFPALSGHAGLCSPVTAHILHAASAAACPALISYNGSVCETRRLAFFPGGDEKQLLCPNTVLTLTIMKWVINCFALMRPCIYCL